MGFWSRLAYAVRYWPIERPLRWIMNRPLRDNPALTRGNGWQSIVQSLPEPLRTRIRNG